MATLEEANNKYRISKFQSNLKVKSIEFQKYMGKNIGFQNLCGNIRRSKQKVKSFHLIHYIKISLLHQMIIQ